MAELPPDPKTQSFAQDVHEDLQFILKQAKDFRDYLRTWIVVSPAKRKDGDSWKEVRQLLTDLIMAVVFGVIPLPVIIKWGGWIACFGAFAFIIQAHNPIARFPWKSRVLFCPFVVICFALLFAKTMHAQWIEEQAAELSGDLIPQGPSHPTQLIMEYGDSGRMMPWAEAAGGGDFKVMYDSGIHLDLGSNGIELTTVVRDSEGQRVAEIDKNHWTVSKFPVVTDKNYTSDSLEVLDRRGHVALQVRILPDRIQLQGEWRDDLGGGIRITTCQDEHTNYKKAGCLQSWLDPQSEKAVKNVIDPIFLYPSKEHWRERVNGH